MKKIVSIFMILIIIFISGIVYATSNDMFELELKVIDNPKNEPLEIYLLLPEKYIKHAMKNDGLYMEYKGVETIKENIIPSIDINRMKVQDEIYSENGIEYVQILLKENEEGLYIFDILSDYQQLDMKYRIKNGEKDYIMHISNFKVEDGKCEIEYNYEKNTVKQPNKIVITFGAKFLIAILIFIVVIGFISYIKQRSA